ncbi:hypothetical protein D5086_020674 [Populus alba]|uniref:Uncharacterized protein n=1 Tax=Populus alba TaxID=43335 RepID=A0ACC4BKQ2_POPAL
MFQETDEKLKAYGADAIFFQLIACYLIKDCLDQNEANTEKLKHRYDLTTTVELLQYMGFEITSLYELQFLGMFLVKAFCILCALNEKIQQVGLATEVEITEAGYSTIFHAGGVFTGLEPILARLAYQGPTQLENDRASEMPNVKQKWKNDEVYGRTAIAMTVGRVEIILNDHGNNIERLIGDAARNQATKDASTIAGFNVIRIINEFDMAYGFDMETNYTGENRVLIIDLGDGIDFYSIITSARFEELNTDFFRKYLQLVNKCLRDGKVNKNSIDDVVLVSDSSWIPEVQQHCNTFTMVRTSARAKSINTNEAVAYLLMVLLFRLTISSDKSIEVVDDMLLLDVSPLSLGLKLLVVLWMFSSQ